MIGYLLKILINIVMNLVLEFNLLINIDLYGFQELRMAKIIYLILKWII